LQRLAVENAWRDFAVARNVPLAIFRLSGIYGPGRNAFVNIEQGRSRRLIKPGQVFNRIHRDGIGKAFGLAASVRADGIFNITDDVPAPPQDVVRLAHELQGSDPPPEIEFETADLSAMAKSFYGENKRVSNARSKSSLGMEYDWPDYRTALARMWNTGSWRGEGGGELP
jgi:nucleoside-diphosphate-sugar epimerase